MEVKFRCSNCLNKICDDGESLGERAKCPVCFVDIDIPSPEYGVGYTIDGFVIEQWLGNGSMGEVHLARQLSMDRPVALKIVTTEKFEDEKDVKRYKREVNTLAKLDHPAIVSAISCGEFEGGSYLAMSYVNGLTIEDMIAKLGYIPEQDALAYCLTVVDALEYAWNEHRILHRDLKPANIMLDIQDKVHLMDMGIAKSLEYDANLTSTGIVLGTPYYMSPEQTCGKNMDFRTDIYSLGATLYHMVTGFQPFFGLNTMQVMLTKLTQLPKSPQKLNKKVSLSLTNLIFTLMAVNPDKRPESWAEVRRLLLKQKDGVKKKRIHVSGDSGKRRNIKNVEEKKAQKEYVKAYARAPKHYAWFAVVLVVVVSLVIVVF